MDEEAPAKLAVKADGTGSLVFGYVHAELDCRMEDVGCSRASYLHVRRHG
jgi:hypothetical protein